MSRTIPTISQQAYNILKEDIFSGKYPPGSWLQENDIASKLGISRSPVREALRLLVADGIATVIPNKGIFVRTYTAKDIENIFEVREAIENYALMHISSEVIESKKDILHEEIREFSRLHGDGDLNTYIGLDARFHRQLVDMNENELMSALYEKAENMNHQFRIISLTSKKRFDNSLMEHASILQCLLDGEKEKACKYNSTHLALARDQVIEYLNSKNADKENVDISYYRQKYQDRFR